MFNDNWHKQFCSVDEANVSTFLYSMSCFDMYYQYWKFTVTYTIDFQY